MLFANIFVLVLFGNFRISGEISTIRNPWISATIPVHLAMPNFFLAFCLGNVSVYLLYFFKRLK